MKSTQLRHFPKRLFLASILAAFCAGGAWAQQISTHTTLTINPNPAAANSDVYLLATVSPQQSSVFVPGGNVTFTDNQGNNYGAPLSGLSATLILNLPQGVYIYTATYSGDVNFTGSVSSPQTLTVTPGTTTTISATPNPANFGQNLTITAAVSPNTATGNVTFYDRATFLGVAPVVNGTATFVTSFLPSGLRSLTARYNGDGNDLASASSILYEGILAKPGLGFGVPLTLNGGTTPHNEVLADFNGDGITDMAVTNNGSATVSIYLGIGNGTFATPASISGETLADTLAAADFNGDGKMDLIVNVSTGLDFLAGNGDGTFQSAVNIPQTSPYAALAVVDLNRDGKADLVGSRSSGGGISVLLGNGDGTFATAVNYATGANPLGIAISDFNTDNNPDVVVANAAGVSVLLGNGDGTLGTAANFSAGVGSNSIVAKDLTGDGNVDLAVSNSSDGTISVLTGNGHGSFVLSGTFPAGSHPTSVTAGDFNGDSHPDLVVSNRDTTGGNNINVLLGTGNGTFLPAIGYAADGSPQSIAVGDFNGDGEADLVVVSPTTSDVSVLLNGYPTIVLTGGSGQSAPVYTTFSQPLSVTAYAFGTPTANFPVAFIAPVNGPSGFFSGAGSLITVPTAGNGVAVAPAYTANGLVGSQEVIATAGGNLVTFNLTNVAQPCTFSVSPTSLVLDSNGGTAVFNVTASAPTCVWSAASMSPFIQIGSNSHTGSGSVNVLVPQNTTSSQLTGSLYVAGVNIPVTVDTTAQVFADVPPTAYYFDAVNSLAAKSITAGCSTTPLDYCPADNVTRAQMAIFLVRSVYGSDAFTYSPTPYFTDVPADAFGFQWIQKLFELGITAGCGPNLYCPNDTVSRDQMAIFIIRARYGAPTVFTFPTTPIFTDVPSTDFAFDWVQRLSTDGITSGCGPSLYCPSNPVIRGDMALFLMRGLFNQYLPFPEPVINSVTPNTVVRGTPTTLTVVGTYTHFVHGITAVYPTPGFTFSNLVVTGPGTFTVDVTVDSSVTPQPYSVYVNSGAEEAVLPNGLIVQ